jgi:hypothetical protein
MRHQKITLRDNQVFSIGKAAGSQGNAPVTASERRALLIAISDRRAYSFALGTGGKK